MYNSKDTIKMKTIILNELSLLNFKGIRNYKVAFDERLTEIRGRNGLGKTTIFDAFTWVLFGKNSDDRKDFGIKTRDRSGRVIPKLPHEVTAVLTVDGERVTLCRRFNEKWVKRRGDTEATFTGHEEERLYNDVPCTVKEWEQKINDICPESTFKFITNPLYFTAQPADAQRAMLFRMAGGVTDEQAAAGNEAFQALLAQITGKTMQEYKREINSKKTRVKEELRGLPARIDEVTRNRPKLEDWDTLEAELNAKEETLESVEEQILDATKAQEAENDRRLQLMAEAQREKERLMNEVQQAREKKSEIYTRLFEKLHAGEREQAAKKQEVEREIIAKEREIENCKFFLDDMEKELGRLNGLRSTYLKSYKEIKSRQLSFDKDQFICPTCKRPLEPEDIERKQQEMLENFNRTKAADIAENVRVGKENSEKITKAEQAICERGKKMESLQAELDELYNSPEYKTDIIKKDVNATILEDPDYKAAEKALIEATRRLQAYTEEKRPDDTTVEQSIQNNALGIQRTQLKKDIDALRQRLYNKKELEKANRRIAELEGAMRAQSAELARLEGIEDTIDRFSQAKAEALESKVNCLFHTVTFRLFDNLINGGRVEACEAMVKGVPFSDANSAAKVEAGLDIIGAICKHVGTRAPIFIDGAESVNYIPMTYSQQVRMYVTEDEQLVVKRAAAKKKEEAAAEMQGLFN